MFVTLYDNAAAGAAPAVAGDGKALWRGAINLPLGEGLRRDVDEAEIIILAEGNGVMQIGYVRIWVYDEILAAWFPIGTGTDADKGKLNADGGFVMGEIAALPDTVRHCERIRGFRLFERMAVEHTQAGGVFTRVRVIIKAVE